MRNLNISSIPLQKLILEACRNLNTELYIKLPNTSDVQQLNEIKHKILELEILIPVLSEIINNNVHT